MHIPVGASPHIIINAHKDLNGRRQPHQLPTKGPPPGGLRLHRGRVRGLDGNRSANARDRSDTVTGSCSEGQTDWGLVLPPFFLFPFRHSSVSHLECDDDDGGNSENGDHSISKTSIITWSLGAAQ